MNDIASEILAHHENWDGSGYPRGVKGEDIPLLSRVMAIIDGFVEITKLNSNLVASDWQVIESYFKDRAGTQYDPNMVDQFLSIINSQKA